MVNYQTKFQDWRFYFKMGFGIFFTMTLLYAWLSPLINGINLIGDPNPPAVNGNWFIHDKGDFSFNLLSFFTIETNIFVALWLICAAIFHEREGKADSKWFGQYMALAITTLIAITGIVYNTMLLPVITPVGFYGWFTNIVFHMVCPPVMVIYFLFLMKREKTTVLTTQLFWRKHLWKYFIYPISWSIVMLIRGEFRYEAGKAWAYQYFFINLHKTSFGIPGTGWFVIAFIFISGIIFGVSTLFNWITYRRIAK